MANKYKIIRGGLHDRFHQSRNKVQVIGGGFGNGKSAAGVIKAIRLAKEYPGSNGIIAMATYAQLNDTIREEFYKWVPPSSVKRWPSIADNTLIFNNGSKVNFRYIKQKGKAAAADGQTSSNLLSATFDWALIDQIENPEITYKDYLDLFGRLRGSTEYRGKDPSMPKTGPRWMMLLANPSFNWVFHKLIKPYKHWQETGELHPDLLVNADGELLIDLFEGSTYENAHNLEPDFIESLEAAYTGQFRKRFLEGEWGAFEGLVYPDFDRKRHMLSRSDIMKHLQGLSMKGLKPIALEGFDFGIASPSCYLYGFVDYLGRVFIIDGFYAPGMSLPQIGERIGYIRLKYYPFMEDQSFVWSDPALFKRTVVDGKGKGADTIARILREDYGVLCKAGQNSIMSGIAKVGSYLSLDTMPHYQTGELNGSAIYFASELNFISDEFMSYFWKRENGVDVVDKPMDKNDHAMDTLKYMVSELPDASALSFQSNVFKENELWRLQLLQNSQ